MFSIIDLRLEKMIRDIEQKEVFHCQEQKHV